MNSPKKEALTEAMGVTCRAIETEITSKMKTLESLEAGS